jgi:hypothetical protein
VRTLLTSTLWQLQLCRVRAWELGGWGTGGPGIHRAWVASFPTPTLQLSPPGGKHTAEFVQDVVEFDLKLLQGVTSLGVQLRGWASGQVSHPHVCAGHFPIGSKEGPQGLRGN